jgi:transposase
MRILAAVAPADFRKGIDGLAQLCRQELGADPFQGTVFLFRNRRATSLRVLVYDGQGFWLCTKRLSRGRFRFWPTQGEGGARGLEAHQVQLLLQGGDPEAAASAAPCWRRLAAAV